LAFAASARIGRLEARELGAVALDLDGKNPRCGPPSHLLAVRGVLEVGIEGGDGLAQHALVSHGAVTRVQ
jgi:hypothetical protein